MKFLFDLFPAILFVAVFKWGGMYASTAHSIVTQYMSGLVSGGPISDAQAPTLLATAVAIIATILQIGYTLLRRRKVDGMLWASFALISIFGGATIYFNDEAFIKWKVTILYWLFSVVLLTSQILLKRNLIRKMMEKQIELPDPVWQKVGIAWAAFFALLGLLNRYVALNYSMDAWVNFKLFGSTGLMFVFVVAQSILLSKYMKDEP
jgi:intracellular septation protein